MHCGTASQATTSTCGRKTQGPHRLGRCGAAPVGKRDARLFCGNIGWYTWRFVQLSSLRRWQRSPHPCRSQGLGPHRCTHAPSKGTCAEDRLHKVCSAREGRIRPHLPNVARLALGPLEFGLAKSDARATILSYDCTYFIMTFCEQTIASTFDGRGCNHNRTRADHIRTRCRHGKMQRCDNLWC
jgi:hypothetical protein